MSLVNNNLNKFWEVTLSSNKLNNVGYWNFLFDIYLSRSKLSSNKSLITTLRSILVKKVTFKHIFYLLQISGLITWLSYLIINKIIIKLITREERINQREKMICNKLKAVEKKTSNSTEYNSQNSEELAERIKNLTESVKRIEMDRRSKYYELREDFRDCKIQLISQGYQNDQYRINNKSDVESIKSTLRSLRGVLLTKSLKERTMRRGVTY
ncbi:hypothetical protein CONCODRAFT_84250 [Conidiobolus coronatus NRRL 28638]|uniref:Uncharacterized protein n=1 Tax=Conidiobolus coronatus (strain ATCC 28846 / CBS 209.66 / NRRL 28638) TaxID=796925 RepID=A0A137PB41_CONC2|nr:hypothetical protein CONCODRAFT_84250 [Conidiobolus coronatus NRRL 28638]|eukprot:KXN72152.1 hypothetical protein CONCODRAFT_84250 [Conidiobolus coronatus NRRL 28638]